MFCETVFYVSAKSRPICYGRPVHQAWLLPGLTLSQTSPRFYGLQNKSFENTVGKGQTSKFSFSQSIF